MPARTPHVPVTIEHNPDVTLIERLERTEFRRGAREVARRFALEPAGFFVARDSDHGPVGAVACHVHPDPPVPLAWIGGMVVLPAARRRGIARALLNRALQFAAARRAPLVGLDASPSGRPLYRAESFADITASPRWTRHRRSTRAPVTGLFTVAPFSKAELRDVAAFDAPRFGANRAPWLAAVLDDLPHRAFIAYHRTTGELAGYVLGQEEFIGPLVADHHDAARLLLHAAENAGTPATAHLLDANPHAASVFAGAAWDPDGAVMTRMLRGGPLPGRPATQYAIGAWALG